MIWTWPSWNPFQQIAVPLCLLLAVVAFVRTLRRVTPRRLGFIMTLLWLTAAITITFPESTTSIAKLVGIDRGANLVLYLAILVGLGVSTYFYHRCRDLEIMITDMVRRNAMFEARRGPLPDKKPADAPESD